MAKHPGTSIATQRLPSSQRARVTERQLARHSIAHVARVTGLHAQTLRDYERKGLIRPQRTSGGKRLFTDADIDRVVRIRALTETGVPAVAARRILRLEDVLQSALDRIQVLEDQNRRLSTRLQRLQLAR